MTLVAGIDLGSTTTKAVLLDGFGAVVGRGITNSRSNYHLATQVAMQEALASARFELLGKQLEGDATVRTSIGAHLPALRAELYSRFRQAQYLLSLGALRQTAMEDVAARADGSAGPLREKLEPLFDEMERDESDGDPLLRVRKSEFFRDEAASRFSEIAGRMADARTGFDALLGVFDKAIGRVENRVIDQSFERCIRAALEQCRLPDHLDDEMSLSISRQRASVRSAIGAAVMRVAKLDLAPAKTIGTGYGRQRLPFAREQIRSEILCHGLGAHSMFPNTRTVLDIGGQDTKAIQVDADGIVTSFQMNDRCAAGCGRYLGYIADEMNLGVHELGPLAQQSTRQVKITSTCTVFAGAELRDRLTLGQRREDILAGLHRAMMLRAMALLARSGGIDDEFTFTGGVANNLASVDALRKLVAENYGQRRLNISPDSIYTGAMGAALFALSDTSGRGGE